MEAAMTPSLTDSDGTVCDGAAELDQLCDLFCAPLPQPQHARLTTKSHFPCIARRSLTADDLENVWQTIVPGRHASSRMRRILRRMR